MLSEDTDATPPRRVSGQQGLPAADSPAKRAAGAAEDVFSMTSVKTESPSSDRPSTPQGGGLLACLCRAFNSAIGLRPANERKRNSTDSTSSLATTQHLAVQRAALAKRQESPQASPRTTPRTAQPKESLRLSPRTSPLAPLVGLASALSSTAHTRDPAPTSSSSTAQPRDNNPEDGSHECPTSDVNDAGNRRRSSPRTIEQLNNPKSSSSRLASALTSDLQSNEPPKPRKLKKMSRKITSRKSMPDNEQAPLVYEELLDVAQLLSLKDGEVPKDSLNDPAAQKLSTIKATGSDGRRKKKKMKRRTAPIAQILSDGEDAVPPSTAFSDIDSNMPDDIFATPRELCIINSEELSEPSQKARAISPNASTYGIFTSSEEETEEPSPAPVMQSLSVPQPAAPGRRPSASGLSMQRWCSATASCPVPGYSVQTWVSDDDSGSGPPGSTGMMTFIDSDDDCYTVAAISPRNEGSWKVRADTAPVASCKGSRWKNNSRLKCPDNSMHCVQSLSDGDTPRGEQRGRHARSSRKSVIISPRRSSFAMSEDEDDMDKAQTDGSDEYRRPSRMSQRERARTDDKYRRPSRMSQRERSSIASSAKSSMDSNTWRTSTELSFGLSGRVSVASVGSGRHLQWEDTHIRDLRRSELLMRATKVASDGCKAKAMHPDRAKCGSKLLKRLKQLVEDEHFDDKDSRSLVEKMFFDSMPRKQLEIKSIEEVLRVGPLKRFLKRVAEEGVASVEACWHGTQEKHVGPILDDGLKPSLCSTGAYGRGAYVGTHAGVAHQYADPNEEGWRHMCCVLVVVGNSVVKGVEGAQCTTTSCDRLVNPTQYCFVEDDRLYCSHLITYRVHRAPSLRTGGGWEDPFQRKLISATVRAAKTRNKDGLR